MAEFSRGEHRSIPLELAQRMDDAPGQHPGDDRGDGDRRKPEQEAALEPSGDAGGRDLDRKADAHQPGRPMRGRIAGEAGHLVAPGRDFAGLLFLHVPDERWDIRKIASGYAGIFREGGDDDALVVDDPHQAARGQITDPYRVLELGDKGADEKDGLNFSCGVPDRPRDREHQFLIPSILHGITDGDRLACKGLLEIIAVTDVVASARRRSDVLTIGRDHGDIGYEAR